MTPQESIVSSCICGKSECVIPYGLCHCGCGRKTTIAKWDSEMYGYIAGMPRRYLSGHHNRLPPNFRGPVRYGIFDNENVAFIPLTQDKETIVDIENEHLSKLNPFLWKDYAAVSIDGRTIKLHTLIFDCPDGLEPDHHNRNKLDNRLSNLRKATRKQQTRNVGPVKMHPTGYKGVTVIPGNKYRSRIRTGDRSINLGIYDSVVDAAVEYDIAALYIAGEFAYLNFPDRRDEYERWLCQERPIITSETKFDTVHALLKGIRLYCKQCRHEIRRRVMEKRAVYPWNTMIVDGVRKPKTREDILRECHNEVEKQVKILKSEGILCYKCEESKEKYLREAAK